MDEINTSSSEINTNFKFRNRELLDSYVILATTNKDGIIEHVSSLLCKTFGFKSSELIGKPYSFLIKKNFQNTFKVQFDDAKMNQIIWRGDMQHSSKDEQLIWTETEINPLYDDNKKNIGYIFTSKDITQEKRLKKIHQENLLKNKFDNHLLDFMPTLSSAVLFRNSSSLHKILWILSFTVVISLFWAYFSKIDDIVKTSGKIITTSNVQTITTLYTGTLAELNVKEGSFVKKGDVLLQMSVEDFKSEYDKKLFEKNALLIKKHRLEAEANDKKMFIDNEIKSVDSTLVENEIKLYESNKEKLNASLNILEEKLRQKKNDLVENNANLNILKNSQILLEKEMKIKESLMQKKAVSQVDYLQLQRKFNDTELELQKNKSSNIGITSSIKEIEKNILEVKEKFKNDAKTEIVKIYSESKKVDEDLALLKEKIKNSTIKAPEDGIVNVINIKTKGEAIAPNKTIMEIIPNTKFVLAEVSVKPSDIGFLYIGQPVRVKLNAYDFSLYGGLQSKISYISADTIFDENLKEERYIVHIKSEQKYLNDNEKLIIKPGMTLDADIITGKKTILDYILRPVMKSLQIEGS